MAPKSYREALLTNGSDNKNDFKIPSKERKIIPIIAPGTETKAEPKSRPSKATKTPSSSKAIETVDKVATQKLPDQPKTKDTNNQRERNIISQAPISHAPNDVSLVQSSLDIFATKYIPAWLRAVNNSTAQLHHCPPFPTLDFSKYIASFVGNDFVREVLRVQLPPLTQISLVDVELNLQNYTQYWSLRLQNEFALQKIQLDKLALYDHKLSARDKRPGYKSLHVPGLRENLPRIDIGDEVHVRELFLMSMPLETRFEEWYNSGYAFGVPCPGHARVLHNPRVWEIDRAKEEVTLRIEDTLSETVKCNVSFLLQESKLEPVFRAIQDVGHGNTWLRKVLFPENADGVMQTALSQANFDIAWFDELNWEQKKAVHSVVSSNYGAIPYLISGPPGTGKTKTLVETALQLIQRPGHILICAPSDAAADTLALRLSVHLKPNELFRLNSWTRTFAEVPDRLLLYTYSGETSFTLPPVEHMLAFKVIVTTCRDADLLNRARLTNIALSGLLNGVQRLFNPNARHQPLHWSALLLDEAAQATEPDVLIPMNVVLPPDDEEFPQFVAAGDQYQLGPKLLSKSTLEKSLFQRLFERPLYDLHPLSRRHGTKSITSAILPMLRPAFTNLIRNYRSHPAILSVPSSLFYNDTLIPERKTSAEVLSWPGWTSNEKWPVLFYQNDSEDKYESVLYGDGTGAGALFNPGEAVIAVGLALSLLRHNGSNTGSKVQQKQIMVMSPFRAQVSHLRRVFRHNNLFEVNIGPLEAFQGLESRIVIICTTRTSLGKNNQAISHHVLIDQSRGLGVVNEPQRLNVAMTRAQEGLIVVGDAKCLTSTRDASWLNFLDYCKRNKCFRAPANYEWPDLGGLHPQGRLERALIYAALSKAEAEQKSKDPVVMKRGNNPAFKLKGPRQNMDEEMWQFKELAQLHDSEHVDLILEYDMDKENNQDGHDSDEEDNHISLDGGYDRDLRQEFHRDCVTQ